MPRVPVDQNQVGLAEVNGQKLRTPDLSGTGGEALGRGLQMLGQGVGQYAEAQDQIQDHANKIGARSEGLAAQQEVNSLVAGFKALQGRAATDQGADYQSKVVELQRRYLDRAGNPRMRRYLEELLAPIVMDAQGSIAEHSRVELFNYTKGTYQSGVALAGQSAVQYRDDLKQKEAAMAEGRDYLAKLATLEGWDANTIATKNLDFSSGVHQDVLDGMLSKPDEQLDSALAYFEQHRGEMTVKAQADFLKDVKDPVDRRQADADFVAATGGGIVAKADAPTTVSSRETMYAITVQSESGGNPNAVSPVGARGLMQVMPGTSRDPGFGIKPSDGSPADDVRVGRQYLDKMMERYGNDPAKAWAAYNWGPGNLDAAIKKHGSNWLANAPKETRDYVAKNVAQLGGGGGGVTETPREWDKDATYNRIDALAAEQGWTPERVERAKRRADQVIARDEELFKREQNEAGEQAFDIADRLGKGFTSLNQLGLLKGRLSRTDSEQLQRMVESNVAAQAPKPNSDWAVALHRMSVGPNRTAPNKDGISFATVDLRRYKPFLTPAEYDEIAKDQARAQAELKNPAAANVQGKIDSAIGRAKNWEQVDISKFDAAEQFRIRNYMQLRAAEEAQGGKTLTDSDYQRFFRDAVRPMTEVTPGILWGENKETKRASEFLSPNMRRVIVDALKRNGMPVTEQKIQEYYEKLGGAGG